MGEFAADRAYDEAIPVETDDDDDVSTPASSEAGSPQGAPPKKPPPSSPGQGHMAMPSPSGRQGDESSGDESSSDESSTSESDGEGGAGASAGGGSHEVAGPAGVYNPDDYNGMKVSSEIEELFSYITRYKPHTIELDTQLKPFIPELIPSIGEVDAFLKMPRPDGNAQNLGLVLLDEPTLNPSDPSILDLQLRSLSKKQDLEPMAVRSIENAEKNPKEIENWVRRIEDLARSKPAPCVQYSKRMPDIEQLMQVWPNEFEDFLSQNQLPDFDDLGLDLPSLVRLMGAMLDVPVYSQMTETLHVIFTLYSEFKTNQHFAKTDTAGGFGQQDPYNFDHVNQFGGQAPGPAPAPVAFGAPSESMAPSRAPSPVK
eukprot:TRINITY_DN12352_c0_g1_i1.p1 TRINITY_DN12352_c0_g1~~TRINITY_DN12352_c0_g1_i1.p1  ORF type:complete len:371 (-),score=121.66 TRINITY_DN12352_c0_g1_i1:116-1228(-)